MKYKKFSFSLLEEIEKKKIEKDTINIKTLNLKNKKNHEQLKILIDYQKEYINKIQKKMMSGIDIYQWQNYNDFISILQKIIKENINNVKKNEKILEESLKVWSKNQIKLKVWKHLNIINKKEILKMKKIREEIINENFLQLKFLKKG
ncbi:flagellar export protein FliJ [Buchnera aphidicola]|uniref:Flagellar FliJ protein n=1 Tax=Buchnera aphidicola (Macrosiphum gaurae) TaxID=2315801 RepID=A0A4D6Y1C4_9GAMM|nr:flagellar FliJ family protein [Buchnera aphidicola]QCI22539.1 flagellar export protein FliJ [Buchnera aphidicola (Macrosiphum gaurae)]